MITRKASGLCIFALALLIASSASNALGQATTVAVVPSSSTVSLGQQVTVNITLTNMPSPGIYAYHFKLTYDKTLLNATNAQIPPDQMLKPVNSSLILILDPGTINRTEGSVNFALTLLQNETSKTGSGTLATVTFQGLAQGNVTVNLPTSDLTLVDGNGQEIPANNYVITPATVQVVPELTVTALIMAFMLISAAAVAFKKKLKK